jgi:hypothetical protein
MGEMRNACNIMTGRSDGTFRDLGIDVFLIELVEWICLAQDKVQWRAFLENVMDLQVL